jgi:hypothetical protein
VHLKSLKYCTFFVARLFDSMTPLTISFSQLQAQVGTTTYLRGQDILKRKRVLKASVQGLDDGTTQITAVTQGTELEPYQQDIVVDTTGAKLSLRGFCTCPVDYNCKHVVAAVLKVSQDVGIADLIAQAQQLRQEAARLELAGSLVTGEQLVAEQAQHAASQWLKQLQSSDPSSNRLLHNEHARLDEVIYTLKYSLKPIAKHQTSTRLMSTLTLGAYLSHPRANGKGWLKPKPLSYHNEYSLDSGNTQQAEAIRLLKLLSPYNTLNHPGGLEGKLGKLAFDLVMTQPNVFLTTSGRDELAVTVTRGEALTLQWHWECVNAESNDPLWQLDWRLEDAQGQRSQVLFYPFEPYLYVDAVRGICGEVELGTMTAKRLKTLLEAPALPTSVIRTQEMSIRQMLGDIALPPVLGEVKTISGIKPTAQLLIARVPAKERYLKGWCSATPQFKYGEHVITWNTQGANVMLPTDGRDERLMLVRDTDTETQLLNSLDVTGMYHHGQTEWLFAPPNSQLLWLQWAG